MLFRKIVLFLAVFSLPLVADTDCATLNQVWKDKLHRELNVRWPLQSFNCPSETSVIAQAFYDLATPKFRNNEVGFAPNFYDRFRTHISYVEFSNIAHPGGKGTGVKSDGGFVFYPGFKSSTRLWRVSALVHEAEHRIISESEHVICRRGRAQGTASCDAQFIPKLFGRSPYSTQVIFLWWLRDGSDSEFTAEEIDRHIRYLFQNAINEVSKKDYELILGS